MFDDAIVALIVAALECAMLDSATADAESMARSSLLRRIESLDLRRFGVDDVMSTLADAESSSESGALCAWPPPTVELVLLDALYAETAVRRGATLPAVLLRTSAALLRALERGRAPAAAPPLCACRDDVCGGGGDDDALAALPVRSGA